MGVVTVFLSKLAFDVALQQYQSSYSTMSAEISDLSIKSDDMRSNEKMKSSLLV